MHTDFSINDIKKIQGEPNHTFLELELCKYAIRIYNSLMREHAEKNDLKQALVSIATTATKQQGISETMEHNRSKENEQSIG